MENTIIYNSNTFQLNRYPKTSNKSLKAYSNAELLVLDYVKDKRTKNYHFYNDRFGVFNTVLGNESSKTIWTYASQKKAIYQNLELNNLSTTVDFKTPLDDLSKVELALLKMPKSLELFELFLNQIHIASDTNTEVVCGFMTKYFSASILKIASKYFEEIEQSKAWKKSRLLILKNPKQNIENKELVHSIYYKQQELKQYYGVFSSGGIDIGTQFLLENLPITKGEVSVLDLASGNGIIANQVLKSNPLATLSLIDDFNLAIESSKLNIEKGNTNFTCNDNLETFDDNVFDLVVSNPPFHFEYENNIEVSLKLFTDVYRVLKQSGRFVLVANLHLNYKTHLLKIFSRVDVLASNKKFEVLQCVN